MLPFTRAQAGKACKCSRLQELQATRGFLRQSKSLRPRSPGPLVSCTALTNASQDAEQPRAPCSGVHSYLNTGTGPAHSSCLASLSPSCLVERGPPRIVCMPRARVKGWGARPDS
eukprot:scaffold979_cov382-Prasinococcus_capsulatus_cf.AAC.1